MKSKKSKKFLSVLMCTLLVGSVSAAAQAGTADANAADEYYEDAPLESGIEEIDPDDYDKDFKFNAVDDTGDDIGIAPGAVFVYGDFTCRYDCYDDDYGNSFKEMVITKYNGSSADVVIPENIYGVSVAGIADEAFKNCTGIKSITIPHCVSDIGAGAFMGCTGLAGIRLPRGISGIGYQTFKNCTALASVRIPDSVTVICGEAFYGCSSLKSVYLPGSITDIYDSAFYGCTSLEAANIPYNTTDVNSKVFGGCSALKCMTVPYDVSFIHPDAFEGCRSDMTVYGSTGSYADGYANENEFPFLSSVSFEQISFVPDSIYLGETLDFSFKGTGGTGTFVYECFADDPDDKTVYSSTNTTGSFTFAPKSSGMHTVSFVAKDSSGAEFRSAAEVEVIEVENNSAVSAESIKKGESVTINASVTAVPEKYQYAYVVQAPNGNWTVLKNYSTAAVHTWTPASAGRYTIQVKAKNSAGTVLVKSFTLNVASALANNSAVSASTVTKGQSVTFTGKATGGTAPYQYAYVVQSPSGKWTVLKGYSTAASHTWTPASTGKYTLQIKVKDSSGTVKIKSFTLNVAAELINNSSVSASAVTKGQSVTFTGKATGGTAPYQYAYVVQAPSGNWTVLKGYSTAASHTWTPASTGKYTLQIKVKDSNGTVKIKSFTLNVS